MGSLTFLRGHASVSLKHSLAALVAVYFTCEIITIEMGLSGATRLRTTQRAHPTASDVWFSERFPCRPTDYVPHMRGLGLLGIDKIASSFGNVALVVRRGDRALFPDEL